MYTGSGGRMHLAYTPEQDRLREQLRGYFAALMTPEVRESLVSAEGDYGDGDAYRQVVRQLGSDGWLALSWPAALLAPLAPGGRLGGRRPLPPGGPAARQRRLAGPQLARRARRPWWIHARPAHLHRRGVDRRGARALRSEEHTSE